VAIQLQPQETSIRRIVQAVIELVNGRHNSRGVVSLATGSTSTVVTAPNCSLEAIPVLSPLTANAAAALATTYIAAIEQGSFTIHHASNAQADRTFGWTATGG